VIPMTRTNVIRTQVDRVADRLGLPGEVVAITAIVLGVIVIVFPGLVAWALGALLVVAGAWHLAIAVQTRRDAAAQAAPPATEREDARRDPPRQES
jgi:hypothetical protein